MIKLDEMGTIKSAYEKFINQTSRYSSTSNTSKIEKVVQNIAKDILQVQENREETAELSDNDHCKEQGNKTHSTKPLSEDTEAPRMFKTSNNTLGSFDISQENIIVSQRCRMKVHVLNSSLSANIDLSTIPPRNFGQINGRKESEAWYAASTKEIESLETTVTFAVVPRPNSPTRVIKLVELFKVKRNMNN
eukprot:snap_masked-scaffold_17-processed-gene-4.9-mRNA-1 protein AED:1.00 eAED:1.00 QI:0/-1/0/0/-1/1/1/0/190